MFIFPPRSYEKIINHHVVFIETDKDIKDGIPILSFLDFDTHTQYIPICVEPLLEFNESLEVIGNQKIQEDQIMINQNMAELLKKMWGRDNQQLFDKELPLQCQTKEGPLTFNFHIEAIVNEEGAGTYAKIYYDKSTLDQLLKNTSYQTQSLYDYVYDQTHYAIISSSDGFKKIYQDYSDLPLFNIELTQEDMKQQTSSYQFYIVIFFSVLLIFQIIFMIYISYKDWKYHLGTFAILLTLGANVNDIKTIYRNTKSSISFSILSSYHVSIQ